MATNRSIRQYKLGPEQSLATQQIIGIKLQRTHHHRISAWWHCNLGDGQVDKPHMQLGKGQGWAIVLCNTQRKEQQEGHNHISILGMQKYSIKCRTKHLLETTMAPFPKKRSPTSRSTEALFLQFY
eukprot:8133079-Ditylum_brightwellii.AAC.1